MGKQPEKTGIVETKHVYTFIRKSMSVELKNNLIT